MAPLTIINKKPHWKKETRNLSEVFRFVSKETFVSSPIQIITFRTLRNSADGHMIIVVLSTDIWFKYRDT